MGRLILVVTLSMGVVAVAIPGTAWASRAIAITPAEVTLAPGERVNFVVTVSGRSDRAIRWSVQEGEAGGSITLDGVYTAPENPGTYHVVAALADHKKHGKQEEQEERKKSRKHAKHTKYADATITVEQPLRPPTSLERVSLSTDGVEANGPSTQLALSANGRFVAFESAADNLVAGDSNGAADIFLRDLYTRTTSRVSLTAVGGQPDLGSHAPAISADGRYVAFESEASTLVPDDTNAVPDIFVKDVVTGTVTRVSVNSAGEQADAPAFHPALSADGRFVAFHSNASNLISADTNGRVDVFVHDRDTGETTRVSITSTGEQADLGASTPAISADGRYVAFESPSSNLDSTSPGFAQRILVRDRQAGTTTRASEMIGTPPPGAGVIGAPVISDDGRYVAYTKKEPTTPRQVRIYDRQTGAITNFAMPDNFHPSLTSNGRFVAVVRTVQPDPNAVVGVSVYDQENASFTNVSMADGQRDVRGYDYPAISADGRYVAFQSHAANLVPDDTNGVPDIFVSPVP